MPSTTSALPQRLLIKIGGSLLDLPDLRERIETLIRRVRPAKLAILVGGGATADIARDWDARFLLGPDKAHWLAIEAMLFNARLLLTLLPNTQLVADRVAVEQVWSVGQIAILNPTAWLLAEEALGRSNLPHCWDVTSDSIAAWLTQAGPFDGLLLAKSCDWPLNNGHAASLAQATNAGTVDPWFARAAQGLAWLASVNLRTSWQWTVVMVEAEQSPNNQSPCI